MEKVFEHLTEEKTAALAQSIAQRLSPNTFIAMFGDLGAGKTTFTKSLAKNLGIDDIQSPTFTIVREHSGKFPLFHFDAYRLADESELYAIGFDDYLTRNGVVVMEWCENVPYALPNERLEIHLVGSGMEERTATLIPYGKKYSELLENVSC